MDRIIAESGVAKMTMYKHFNSKENLIVECLKFLHADMKHLLLEEMKYHKNPLTQLERAYFWYIDLMLNKNFNGDMFQKARTELLPHYPSIQSILEIHQCWLYKFFLSLFEQLNLKESRSFTQLFISILEGMMSSSTSDKKMIDPQKTWNYIHTLIELEKNQK